MWSHQATSVTGLLTNQLQSIQDTAVVFRSYTITMGEVTAGVVGLQAPRLSDVKMSGSQILGNSQFDAAAIRHGKVVLYNAFAEGLLTHNLCPAAEHATHELEGSGWHPMDAPG